MFNSTAIVYFRIKTCLPTEKKTTTCVDIFIALSGSFSLDQDTDLSKIVSTWLGLVFKLSCR